MPVIKRKCTTYITYALFAHTVRLKTDAFLLISKYGNTSAGSVPIAMAEAVLEGRIKKGDIVATVGFGAGLTWASAIFRW